MALNLTMESNEDFANAAVLIMAKEPRPGFVKTRLRPLLSDEACAELARCFLADAVAKAGAVTPNVIVALANADDGGSGVDFPDGVVTVRQQGSDLGERLAAAFEFAFAQGFSPVVVTGTDSPTLPLGTMRAAVRELAAGRARVALCGTDDGGYCLLGLREPMPALFEKVPWSTGAVYEATLERARAAGADAVAELAKWYDVDTPADLARLAAELSGIEEDSGEIGGAPHTSRWIAANRNLFD